ncbi:cysteine desulfurase family protein [Spirulina major CS-329]|uniref:cysteine desulfurase family protein n=1 Tax=Spirulina TaxID=1154 RepID=UPI00232E45F4|nr:MULTISPECIES: cysteine desulfurase family protein [Spirulina]MDB9496195.1 cysteine desulfurase family protein [Spirulina subsalsa CS-330]MDB9502838.1 cysteine desulfurase family protein [Spirulina major CS-329]
MIYLDNHATTPLDPRIAPQLLAAYTQTFGNPSSTDHRFGDAAAAAVKTASQQIAQLLHCRPRQIIFTSGATESLNLAILGTVNPLIDQGKRPRVACTPVEHKAVLETCRHLAQSDRIDWITLPVDRTAQIDLDAVEACCAQGLDLLCGMAANNEVGTIYPVREMSAIAHRYGVPYLCDAAQAVGKIPLQFQDWGITMLAVSAHKCYGPKGSGALLVQDHHRLAPMLYGGGQQRNQRPGTLNVPGIVGLGAACHLRQAEMTADETAIAQRRDRLQTQLQTHIPDLVINGDPIHRLAGNLHISIPGIPNSAITARLRDRVALSTGSACTSGVEAPSHVLQAMHLPADQIEGAIRIGLGKFTTDAELDQAAPWLIAEVDAIRTIMA